MRMTNLTMERNLLFNLTSAEERLQSLQDMATSGMKFQKPQDDPVGVQRSMSLRNQRTRNDRYLQNLSRAKSFMEYTEKALSGLTATLSRTNEIGLAALNGTTPQDAREAIAKEIRALKEEVDALAQMKMEGRPVLTGTMPTWKVGETLTMTTDDLTTLLTDASTYLTDLENGIRGIAGSDPYAAMSNLDRTADAVLAQRATNGARVARVESLESKLTTLGIEYKRLLSDVEDVDIAEVIVKLKSAEASYQAALGAGARLIQPSLLDYLK